MHYNLTKMKELAIEIAKNSKIRDIILINGELGVGKTTFTRFFINYFLPGINVTSPTFNLLNVYDISLSNQTQNGNLLSLWHFDLFNLNNECDLYELGIEEALESGISIVEWPQILLPLKLNYNTVTNINIKFSDIDGNRFIEVSKLIN